MRASKVAAAPGQRGLLDQQDWTDRGPRRRTRAELEALGWRVLVVWECEIKNHEGLGGQAPGLSGSTPAKFRPKVRAPKRCHLVSLAPRALCCAVSNLTSEDQKLKANVWHWSCTSLEIALVAAPSAALGTSAFTRTESPKVAHIANITQAFHSLG